MQVNIYLPGNSASLRGLFGMVSENVTLLEVKSSDLHVPSHS